MTPMELPASGYFLVRIYASDISLTVQQPPSSASESHQIIFGWDWTIIDEEQFEVHLNLGVDPADDRWERVRVTLNGRFRVGTDTPTVGFENFVRLHAVAILMPYARELLQAITSRGFYDPVILPAINIMRLMEDKDLSKTTGMNQLKEGAPPSFASALAQGAVSQLAPGKPKRRRKAKRSAT